MKVLLLPILLHVATCLLWNDALFNQQLVLGGLVIGSLILGASMLVSWAKSRPTAPNKHGNGLGLLVPLLLLGLLVVVGPLACSALKK